MNFRASSTDCVFKGHYTLSDNQVRFNFLQIPKHLNSYPFEYSCFLLIMLIGWKPAFQLHFIIFFKRLIGMLELFMAPLSLQVEAAVLYPGLRPTVLRIRLRYSNYCL